jgi:hypothetical protein
LVPPHQGPVRSGRDQIPKTQLRQCSCQPAQANPSGHSRHTGCLLRLYDEPFDCLKNALLGQFGKSKWQSYFELLRLPMEMEGLKPSVGKLKQHLPLGVSPETDLFLAMFSYSPTAFHAQSSRSWQPQDGRSHGEGCRRTVGCLRQPRTHGHGRHDSAQ